MPIWGWILAAGVAGLGAVALYDVTQRKHAILRNFPVIGHFRYWLEAVGPELRQYIVTSNDEERPFSRDQRRWVYTSAKREDNYFGFGTDNDLEKANGYVVIRHSAFPLSAPHPGAPDHDATYALPCAKILGGHRRRAHAFRPRSLVNTSAMSYGSLSGAAIEAINLGVAQCGALQNTGEGGIAKHHRLGGELIWQIGTGYFGCRNDDGSFSMEKFLATAASAPVKAIEIKLSQGAKPGVGGFLPGAKVSDEIAHIRGIRAHKDCASPAAHSAFHDVDSMLDFIETLADATGLPIGIKSAVGDMGFWRTLGRRMRETGRAPDFVTIDGGEGGTGAAPLVFADHVALPFKLAFSSVYRTFAEEGVHEQVVFAGAGRLGFPDAALLAIAMGCDLVNVGREAMMAIGCIQAQKCHTGTCPTGVATQSPWLVRGLDPHLKSARLANYIVALRKELIALAHACGVEHPALVPLDAIEILDDHFGSRSARDVFAYQPGWGLPTDEEQAAIRRIARRVEEPPAPPPEAGVLASPP